MLAHMTMGQTPYYQQEEMTALQARMLNLENALTRVIRHMEDQSPSGEGQRVGRDPVRDDWESDVLTAVHF